MKRSFTHAAILTAIFFALAVFNAMQGNLGWACFASWAFGVNGTVIIFRHEEATAQTNL